MYNFSYILYDYCYMLYRFSYKNCFFFYMMYYICDFGYTAYSFQLQTVRLKYLIKGSKCFQKIIKFFIVGKICIYWKFIFRFHDPKGNNKTQSQILNLNCTIEKEITNARDHFCSSKRKYESSHLVLFFSPEYHNSRQNTL